MMTAIGLVLATALGVGAPERARAQDDWPTVAITPSPTGPMLTDADGWTLYTWERDGIDWSNCTDTCASIWPPLTIPGEPSGPDDLPGTLGVMTREDGTLQATYDGWPLYYYGGDGGPGDARGDGLTAFGARWFAVRLADTSAPLASPLPPAPSVPFAPGAPSFTSPADIPPPTFSQSPSAAGPVQPPQLPPNYGQPPPGYGPAMPPGYPPQGYAPYPQPPYGRYPVGPVGPVPYGPGYGQPGYGGPGYSPTGPAPVDPSTLFPTTAQTAAPTTGAVGITWSPMPFARSYRVYQSTSANPGSFTPVQTVTQTAGGASTNTTIQGLAPGVNYFFQVRAVDPNGVEIGVSASTNVAPGAAQNVPGTPVAPSAAPPEAPTTAAAPTGLTVTGTTPTSASLTWTATSRAASYQVGMSPSPAGPFTYAAGTAAPSATISGLAPYTTYYFQVRGVDASGGLGPASDTVSATTPADFVATMGLSIQSTTSTSAILSWTPITAAKSYQVGQALTAAGPFVTVLDSPTSLATVSNLTPNTTYYFQIRALDGSGSQMGNPSAVASTTTTAP